MRKRMMIAALAAVTAIPLTAAAAAGSAVGTPHRSAELPPGLSRVLETGVPGILRALEATQGSNSRLQDRPASP